MRSVPQNAYPLASQLGRAVPLELVRPLWYAKVTTSTTIVQRDSINLIEVIAGETEVIITDANTTTTAVTSTESPAVMQAMVVAANTRRFLVVSEEVTITGACTINGYVLWEQIASPGSYRSAR